MSLYTSLVKPVLFQLNPESAHLTSMSALDGLMAVPGAQSLAGKCLRYTHPSLEQTLWGLNFPAPVGLAAGFDKNAEHVSALAGLGFSHIEVGSVTAHEQPGNPKPRAFRLPKDESLINRMGFNNHGAEKVAQRIASHYGKPGNPERPPVVLGINIGKSKAAGIDGALDDHLASVDALAAFADYLVVNVSCPNVKGVTGLQEARNLIPLLNGVRARLHELAPQCPLLLKVAPDLGDEALDEAVDIALDTGVVGIIATNTSTGRDGLQTKPEKIEAIGMGGLSGAAIRDKADAALAQIARKVDGKIPLIGLGGIDSVEAAWRKICLGASLVQVYTGFIYRGPFLMRNINRGLVKKLQEHHLNHISEAVGRDL